MSASLIRHGVFLVLLLALHSLLLWLASPVLPYC